MKPVASARRIGWLWVAAQFGLLAALVLAPTQPRAHAAWPLGWLVFAAGLGIFVLAYAALGDAFTPNPVPKAQAQLVQRGVYRLIRHPMYSAALVCALGWSLVFGGAWHYGLSALLLVFFYAKSRAEEAWLLQQHAGYAAYRLRTGRFVPRLFKSAE